MPDFFAFIQARTNSTRLNSKVLKKIGNKEILLHIHERISKVIPFQRIIFLIPEGDEKLKSFFIENNLNYFEGSETDVLDRFIRAAKKYNAEYILRLTGDNPFIDIEYIEALVDFYHYADIDIASFKNLPLGMGVEAFKFSSIQKIPALGLKEEYKEHVSLHLKQNPEFEFYKLDPFFNQDVADICSKIRVSVDEENDFEVCEKIYSKLSTKNPLFGINEIVELYKKEPELFQINQAVKQLTFTVQSQNSEKKIFLYYADPKKDGRGHYERCKSISILLQKFKYSVYMNFELDKVEGFDFYLIDARDKPIPEKLLNQKLILLDNFSKDRYFFPSFDTLPHMLNDFEDIIHTIILPYQIKNYKNISNAKKIFCYAGSIGFRETYILDRFLEKHFSFNYEILRVGGFKRKEKHTLVKNTPYLNKAEFLKSLAECEIFVSYFGQSVLEASYFGKKILLYSISDYHEELAYHFVQNTNAMYAGNLQRNSLNEVANFEKYIRPIDFTIPIDGLEKLVAKIQDLMS
jgi:spore coat polysaccharide biosynthesis protein SpsF